MSLRRRLPAGSIRKRLSATLRRHSLAAYFVLALALSWAVEVPLALTAQGVLRPSIPFSLHYLAAFGPMLAAIVLTAATGGRQSLRALLGSAAHWRLGTRWLLVAVGSPIALFAGASVVARVVEGAWPRLERLGEVNFLGDIGVPLALGVWIATFGFGEEIGWRGFALPRLQTRHGALVATLILAAGWGVWHVPTFFYVPAYVRLGLAGVPGFAIGLVLGAVLLTWLYNSTGGSIFGVAIWHSVYDFSSASPATDGLMNAVIATAVMVWAVAMVVIAGPTRLSSGAARHRVTMFGRSNGN